MESMPGPNPKNSAVRQRRNRRSTTAMLASQEGMRKRIPSLPKLENREWQPMTRAWWRDIWHSPMAAEYLHADIHALYRLATLIDDFWVKPTQGMAAEIRLQQQAFGLTPLDRRRLEWTVAQAETAKQSKGHGQQPPVDRPVIADPRDLLKNDVIVVPEPGRKFVGEAKLPN